MKRTLFFLFLVLLFAPQTMGHGGEDHGDEKKAAAPVGGSAPQNARRAQRTVNTADGQFQFFLTQTPSDPRTGEEAQFEIRVVELIEGGFSGGQAPVEDAKVIGQLKTAGGDTLSQAIPAHGEGSPGVYGIHYKFEKQGDFKVFFEVATSDGRKATSDFPVAVAAAPIRYAPFLLDFALLIGAVSTIFAGYRKALRSFGAASALKRALPFAAAVAALLIASIALVHELIPITEPRAAADSSATTAGSGSNAIIIPKESQIAFGIRTHDAKEEKIVSGVTVTGVVKVRPQFTAEVVPPVSGRVKAAGAFTVGSYVKEGQTLAVVEQVLSAPEIAGLEATRTELKAKTVELQSLQAQARARRNAAEIELNRAKKLHDAGASPLKRVQEAELQLKLAEQELDAAQKQAQITQTGEQRVDPTKSYALQSPISGIITAIAFTNGQQVEAGKSLYAVMNLDRVWIEAQVFEKDLAVITTAKRAAFKAAALPDEVFQIGDDAPNRLLTVGASVDPEKKIVPVIYEVENKSGKLRDGMSAEITIDTTGDRAVVSVPKSTVIDEQAQKFVYVYQGGELFEKRAVTVGSEGQTDVEILTGLKPGERVVVEGIYQLRSTAPVAGS